MNTVLTRRWLENEWNNLQRLWQTKMPFALDDVDIDNLACEPIPAVRSYLTERLLAATLDAQSQPVHTVSHSA